MGKQPHIQKKSKISNPFFQFSEKMQPGKKKLQSLKSEAIIANNDDLLLEILVRLPVKSLLRFKSVSKRWFSLISSPDFCRSLHPDPYFLSGILLQSDTQSRIHSDYLFVSLRDDPDNASTPRPLSFANDPCGIRVLQSCNGLLLCSGCKPPAKFDKKYYTYNPATRQHITLPLPGQDLATEEFVPLSKTRGRRYWYVDGVSLAFDPAKSPHYKVVCARHFVGHWKDEDSETDNSYSYQIQIYSSESRAWRVAGDRFIAPDACCALFDRGIFCNGAIHWISWYGPSLYFSVEEEAVQELPMPPVPDGWENRRYVYFGESRHHLHLTEIYKGPTTQFDIYEMDKDHKGWSVKYKVDLDALTNAFPAMVRSYSDPSSLHHYKYEVVCVSRQVNEDDSYLVLHVPGKIIHYNLKDKTFRKIFDVEEPNYDEEFCIDSFSTYLWWGAFQYLESFCSL